MLGLSQGGGGIGGKPFRRNAMHAGIAYFIYNEKMKEQDTLKILQ
jgi:hypothetical protein